MCSRGRTYMTTCTRVHSSIREDHYVDGCVKLGGCARDMEVGENDRSKWHMWAKTVVVINQRIMHTVNEWPSHECGRLACIVFKCLCDFIHQS